MGPQAAFSIAEAGARTVVFADPDEKTAQAAAEEAKLYATNPDFESVHFIVDICDERSVAEMVDFVVDQFGRVDYAVNASGVRSNLHTRR
jgi:NAD(P)-dependent dehydrogenase (short-subunit alcohol dehydrogenase family)